MSPARPRARKQQRPIIPGNLLQGDCLEIMPGLPAGTVDLVLTDPPCVDGADTGWLTHAYAEMYRLLRPDSLCITFYDWANTDAFFAAWRAAGFRIVGHLVFCKDHACRERTLKGVHDPAYVLVKGRAPAVAPAPSDVRPCGYIGSFLHPMQKSVDALKPLIDAYTRRGDLVLDPFAGSGTSLVAARELERRYLGIEIDPAHAVTAKKRLR